MLLLVCSVILLSNFDQSWAVSNDYSEIDPTKTLFWGPGLKPVEIVMRARYIFLQLRDSDGKNLTKSPGEGVISEQIEGKTSTGGFCRIWSQKIDCRDGSFIIRYRLYKTCFNLRISIKVKDTELSVIPPVFKGPVIEDECDCPQPSATTWLKSNECPQNYSQILQDLNPFQTVNFDKMRPDIIKEYHKPNSVSICHYVVKSNKIYRRCYGQHVGFKIFMDSVLLSLARKVILPDVEFFMNLGDWPLVPKKKLIYPIFSWCGSEETADILLPTYDIAESSLESMGRVMLDMLSVQGSTKLSWEEKENKAFWRGRDARRERLDLIDIARDYPDLINASITNFFFFRDEIEKYGPGQTPISFFNFFEYKYQLNIDGTVAAYRFPYLLAGGSLVFKQDSQYYEFFYKQLTPGEHYIPIKSDLSDLVEKIKWAQENDDTAHKISRTGRQFARDNLMPKDVLCYHVALFEEWSKRLTNKIEVLPEMEEVSQPKYSCECSINFSNSVRKSEL
ncbi:protein O-glucosyltransferase 2-like [Belonocnema kinseyi]|uniref:protein O-glucosyltransferase 2-like n=1 Tax=Belonocnema kinseyi TaxID=2817044 RepID=UPI00143D833F|nr:protein O-glucosyltransferase 2-like [Belonocnema kinseyi]